MKWHNFDTIGSKIYTCGHCGNNITSNIGYHTYDDSNLKQNNWGKIYICHRCNKPTFFCDDEQIPGFLRGKNFSEKIFSDEIIKKLYNESQRCFSVGAYSSVGMCCRKLLMHIAVDCGAKKNLRFIEYVNYLDENNFIPQKSKKWVDLIRDKGNETTHEIIILDEQDAIQLLKFIEVLITIIYEMPYEADNLVYP